jgi:23S rRNA pseudouridine2605 synthase
MSHDAKEGERISKHLSRAGVCSRRDAERMIAEGRVRLNGDILKSPAINVTDKDKIEIDGRPLQGAEQTRLWLYHKPRGLITTHKDEQDRPTIFQNLPQTLPRVISVGRLDMNSEGLLLLTNDGALSRHLELPSTGWARQYRVRAYGNVAPEKLARLEKGITIDGIRYGPIAASVDIQQGANVWIDMTLHEGKNREIRRVLEHLGLQVNRLIRVSYGPFDLNDLQAGEVEEVPQRILKTHM